MKLDYATLLSPNPIKLSLGIPGKFIELRKPKLIEIDREISIKEYGMYENFLKINPRQYYTTFYPFIHNGDDIWDELDNDFKNELTLFGVIKNEKYLQDLFCEIFGFFFNKKPIYFDNKFIFLNSINRDVKIENNLTPENVIGAIGEKTFDDILFIIQQTCAISSDKPTEMPKFKNNIARKLYERMQKAKEEAEEKRSKKIDKNLSLTNIISKVSNFHPSINPLNVWELTKFQLIDSFNSLRINERYDIQKTAVSVWGDEKGKFDQDLWYKNLHDE